MKAKTLIGRSTFSKLPALKISAPLAKHRHRKSNMTNENQMDRSAAGPPQAKEEANRGVTHARKAAEDLRSAAGAMADEYRERGKEVLDDALHRVRSFQDDSKQYVRENPTKAVFTALGVGFVLGLIFRR